MSDLPDFLSARIADRERQFDLPDFLEEDSARGPGWGNRGECPICGAHQFSGTEPVTEEAWWEHAEEVHQRTFVLAECEAKREIIRLHESWPVLVEGPVEFDPPDTTITGLTMRATQRMAWLTGQEYRARFGSEPPTTPMLRALALPYASHPDYDGAWRP